MELGYNPNHDRQAVARFTQEYLEAATNSQADQVEKGRLMRLALVRHSSAMAQTFRGLGLEI